MPECAVCGGGEFVEEDGLFYCSECNTRNEDARVQVYEDKIEEGGAPPSQWMVSSQVRVETDENASNVKILTSWETFNICLKGLVDQLVKLGATPKFEALVFRLWTDYLKKTNAAFFSMENRPPTLPNNAWASDALLVHNLQNASATVEEMVGKKRKGTKRQISKSNEDDKVDDPNEDVMPPTKLTKTQEKLIKRNFFNKSFANKANETGMQDITDLKSLTYVPEEDSSSANKQILSKRHEAEMVPLRRKHLLAFLYLGTLLSHEEVYLSDILRWIDEGHLYYYQLNKLFMPGVAVLDDLKEYFMEKKYIPTYSDISSLTRKLAIFLDVHRVAPPDLNRLVHKYCNEFNLPNQVALVSRRLVNLLPTRVQDPQICVTMTSYETRAMAQIIVTLKILLGLDDATEHRNSKIAANIREVLKRGGSTIEPFIWDEWVRWSALRSIALLLHGQTSVAPPKDTGLYQNIDSLISVWGNYVSSSLTAPKQAGRRKMETEMMSELIRTLDKNSYSYDEEGNRYPPTMTPLASYTEAIIEDLVENKLPCRDDSWNSLVRNVDFSELRLDFRSKSIEYLLHPERYIEWAQQKGLSVGLRNGGAFGKAYKSSNLSLNKESYLESKTTYLATLSKKSKKTGEKGGKSKKNSGKEVLDSGAKSVVLPATTKPDKTNGRPLEPLQDLTDRVPPVRTKTEPSPAPPPATMPPPEQEEQYLHLPSTEYHTQPVKSREAPISFLYLTELAARYLRISKLELSQEITYLENIHKNFLDFCSGKINPDSPEIIALKE